MSAVIRGAKGGGKQHTPVESPDSLRSIAFFRILDLVSEGEIGGLVNGQQSIFLDETPLANADGTSNFPKAHIEQRTGTQDQEHIPGFDSVENEISIGVELRSSTPWLRSISDTTLSAARVTLGVPALSKADTGNGDINGYTIAYKIEVSTDGGAFVSAYNGSFTGKTTTKFQRSHRIDLPTATTGWQIKVTRLTANADSSSIADTTTVDSYTEIVDAKLRYPNSALIGVMGDASQFSNIPQRAYDLWGRIIKVPSNYDVTTRTYTGVWDGTFVPSWTDNPAWIFYDLVTHPRYGLGHLITASQVDKWELYRIGQYCDGMVDDGNGGTEPRLTCNIYLQTQADAYKLLSDLSSAFRGISYWANGSIVASADMPSDPVYTYTDANVIDGKFTYSASSRKTRFTTALVSWNDPRNFYRTKVEYVEDRDGVARYGIQQTEVTAVGCTSQGQAQRLGRWILLTSRYETDTITFSVGMDGTLAAPGQIIRVADSARAGKRQGGRIHSATTTTVTVDKAPTVAIGDTLTVIMSDGVAQTRTVASVSGTAITVTVAFTSAPVAESMWVVESGSLAAQTFRVLSVTEDKSDSGLSFTITALQHNASKFDAVDNGTLIQVPPISSLTITNQPGPSAVGLDSVEIVDPAATTKLLTLSWTAVHGALSYEAEWRKDNGEWQSLGRLGGLSADIRGAGAGDYIARVRAKGTGNSYSLRTYSNTYTLGAASTLPTTVAGIQTEASDAAAAAAAANAELANIASDNLLTPGEKPTVIRDYNVILTEQAGIDTQAVAFGITTEKTAYDGKVTALTSYLATLTSAVLWSDLSGNTTIVGSTFRSKFADVYTTRQALLNAIYAAAKVKADDAQDTADTAKANAPAVINPQFSKGLASWSPGVATGWSAQNGGANLPDPIVNTAAVHTAGGGAAVTDALRNAGHIPVVAGQQVTVTCCVKEASVNSGALGYARISWRDAANAEISVSVPAGNAQYPTCGAPGTGTYTNCVTKVIGAAPIGAQYAVAEATVTGHTAGQFLFCNVCMSAQPSSVDELPDGATYARTQAFILQNGVPVPAGTGDNIIPNHSFGGNDAGIPGDTALGSGEDVCDGWHTGSTNDDTYMYTVYETAANRVLIHLNRFVTVPANTTIQASVFGTRKIPVTGGETLYAAATMAKSANQTYPSTVTLTVFAGLHFYDSSGAIISDIGVTADKTLSSSVVKYATINVPSNAAYALPLLRVTHATGAFAWDTSPGIFADIRITDLQVVRQTALETAGSGRTLGNQLNAPNSLTLNYGSVRSSTALSATSSGAVSVSAFTYYMGSASVHYNAVSNAVTGLTQGSTYFIYCHDAGGAGGTKSWAATTNVNNLLQAYDDIVVAGQVTIPSSGSSGGGGSGLCVCDDMLVAEGLSAGTAAPGDLFDCMDMPRQGMTKFLRALQSVERSTVECVRLTTEHGAVWEGSASTPFDLVEGGVEWAPRMQGRQVVTDRGIEAVVCVEHIGLRPVSHIHLGGCSYAAGLDAAHRVYSHNLQWKP